VKLTCRTKAHGGLTREGDGREGLLGVGSMGDSLDLKKGGRVN